MVEDQLYHSVPARFRARLLRRERDGSLLLTIPAGHFEQGDGEDEDCPSHSVHLREFAIGAFAVTNRQYRRFVQETGHRPPDDADWGSQLWRDGNYPSGYDLHPVVCVSWDDAVAYCSWAGLRLPTEAQWEKAARGPDNLRYPWSNRWELANCLNYMNKGEERTCAVNAHAEGLSGYGPFNMAGNILEWCNDWYDKNYYRYSPRCDPEGPEQGLYRVARGGSWGGGPHECRCACRSDFNYPDERASFRGFRVALL